MGLTSLEVRNALRFSLCVDSVVDISSEIVEVKDVSPGLYRLMPVLPTSNVVRSQTGVDMSGENVISNSSSMSLFC
jgi:hypothetical protein